MAGPPTLNLARPDGALDPLAYRKLQSVILHATDRAKRAAFMARARRAIKRKKDFEPAPSDITAARRGVVAGEMLLRLLQLDEHDPPTSVNRALPYVRACSFYAAGVALGGFLPMEKLEGSWHKAMEDMKSLPFRVHRKEVLACFRDFRPVAHFWAMLIIVHDVEDRGDSLPTDALPFEDLRPDTERTLPRFVAAAEVLARRAGVISFRRASSRRSSAKKKREAVLPLASTWRVRLPEHLRVSLRVPIPKISPYLKEVLAKTSRGETI